MNQESANDKLNVHRPNKDASIPNEHQEIVLDRIAKANVNPERLLDWDEVSKTLE